MKLHRSSKNHKKCCVCGRTVMMISILSVRFPYSLADFFPQCGAAAAGWMYSRGNTVHPENKIILNQKYFWVRFLRQNQNESGKKKKTPKNECDTPCHCNQNWKQNKKMHKMLKPETLLWRWLGQKCKDLKIQMDCIHFKYNWFKDGVKEKKSVCSLTGNYPGFLGFTRSKEYCTHCL